MHRLTAAALALLLPTQALAFLDKQSLTVTEDVPPGSAHFAEIHIYNGENSDTNVHTLTTSKGDVIINYSSTPNANCERQVCDDWWEIRHLPDGVTASMLGEHNHEEGKTIVVYLYVYIGG